MSLAPFILLAAGSRALANPRIVGRTLGRLVIDELCGQPLVVRHGACPGEKSADQAVSDWVDDYGVLLGVTQDPHPADWDHCAPDCPTGPGHRRRKVPGDVFHPGKLADYCPAAGPRRNAQMAGLGADRMIAFPNPHGFSYGTRNCIRCAKAAGISVLEVTR